MQANLCNPRPKVFSSRLVWGGLAVWVAVLPCALAPPPGVLATTVGAEPPVDFARDVRPILAARCLACHGPDKQESGLRLDQRKFAAAPAESGEPAIVPGDATRGGLLARVASRDDAERMPPRGEPLTAAQIETLRRWIAAGADFPAHWSNIPPRRAPPPLLAEDPAHADGPAPRRADGAPAVAENFIDCFVHQRLAREGLAPNPPADRYTLIRRLSLDLTGLPPSLDEIEAFAADAAPDAYPRLVDRLLASPRFGERWAAWWLDQARYADTHGYESDEPRVMWPYRDWVINAFNYDWPFDRFTIDQLAGDMLPDDGSAYPVAAGPGAARGGAAGWLEAPPAPLGADARARVKVYRLVATGFHRNTPINTEGGAKEDEFKDAAIKDRVDTTAAVWLGATMNCAQCHNHKYDELSRREYYQLYAFFQNTTDKAISESSDTLDLFYGEPAELTRREAAIRALDKLVEASETDLPARQAAWERATRAALLADAKPEGLPAAIEAVLRTPPADRTARQAMLLKSYYRTIDPPHAAARSERELAFQDLERFRQRHTTSAMIMKEGPRLPAFEQIRGDFLKPGAETSPDVPAVFGLPLSAADRGAPPDRLALARWLTRPDHPRVARVTVNRVWAALFGRGLVATSEDFGVQGDLPSHPELLDHLAVEFVGGGWSLKRLLRTIALSATYQRDARQTRELRQRDSENALLARGPRFRLEAEQVRDVALATAGLLSPKLGGPSVFPPQPAVVFENLFLEGGFAQWPESQGEERWRRGLYTFVKRTALHPQARNFDMPNRAVCSVQRKRSNTPMAALNTLNDPTFVEAAGGLARRLLDAPGDPAEKARLGLWLARGRPPREADVAGLLECRAQARAHYTAQVEDAVKLLAAARLELNADERGDAARADAAAWVLVANTLLNLDAALTKP